MKKNATIILITLFSVLVWGAPAVSGPADSGGKTVAIIELAQETNAFSPVPTTRRDFEARSLLYGEEIIAFSRIPHPIYPLDTIESWR
ncbi:MAG: M81 family metallopeptidase [Desulfobacterales bacterium]|nr:M81 family metallopeptidase [Desulfobacterales bacterium]